MPPPPPSFNPNATRPQAGPSGATTRPSTVNRPGAAAATRPGATVIQPGLRGGRPAPAAPARVDYGPLLDKLAADIEAMHLEYERFFNGGLQVPPVASKSRVEAQLKQLRNAQIPGSADRFRLSSLEARFTSYSELFGRRLRDKEEGGRRPRPSAAEREAPSYDAEAGISFGTDAEPAAVEALFERLHRGGTTPPRFDLDSFGTYLRSQLQAIQQKTGCREVQFRVATEEGKLKLKARPLGSR